MEDPIMSRRLIGGSPKKTNSPKTTGDPGREKKSYDSPKLVSYGDIRSITQNVGMKMKKDGGAKPLNKSAI